MLHDEYFLTTFMMHPHVQVTHMIIFHDMVPRKHNNSQYIKMITIIYAMMFSISYLSHIIFFYLGRQVLVEHYRVNPAGKVVELERIDQNLNYDFNRQQYTHLAKEHIVLPVNNNDVQNVHQSSDSLH